MDRTIQLGLNMCSPDGRARSRGLGSEAVATFEEVLTEMGFNYVHHLRGSTPSELSELGAKLAAAGASKVHQRLIQNAISMQKKIQAYC